MKTKSHQGIQFLRFASVLWVGIFHYFYFRSYLFPFHERFSGLFFSTGWLGVRVFFIISGFVIANSLQTSKNFVDFATKRAKRLYPSLWMILPVVFFSQKFIPDSPFLEISRTGNLLVSMTLLPPNILNWTLGLQLNWVTLVLWSLKVEVIFYLTIALIHFSRLKSITFHILFVVSTICSLVLFFSSNFPSNSVWTFAEWLIRAFGWDHLSWFCLGIFISMQLNHRESYGIRRNLSIWVTLILSITLLMLQESATYFQLLLVLGVVFATCVIMMRGQVLPRIFKPLILLGDCSYEMYLLHQGFGLTLAIYLVNRFDTDFSASVLICLIMLIICFLLSHFFFKFSKRVLQYAIPRLFDR